jgi:hypothetical protein
MELPLNSFAPELRDLEKTTLNQLHAAIHQKEMRNSDRLLISSHLIDRYIEERARIVVTLTKEVGEQSPE